MSTTTIKTSPRVSFASITPNNLGTVRKLNAVLFPIKYSEKFYRDILQSEVEDFCKLIYYNDIPVCCASLPAWTFLSTSVAKVGNICCRLENKDDQTHLYLMTMGVLAPYRSRGLGSQSLQLVLKAAESHAKPKVNKIYLHVQVSNDGAKAFYECHGFMEVEIHKDYYRKIEPHDAWVLEKVF